MAPEHVDLGAVAQVNGRYLAVENGHDDIRQNRVFLPWNLRLPLNRQIAVLGNSNHERPTAIHGQIEHPVGPR